MRYASIDVLRTVAIVLMVVVHFLENLSGAVWSPGDFGAPLFTFLTGVSFRLWVLAQEAAGKSEEDISKVAVRRGLFLFVLGVAFNVLVWLPDDAFNWDVLTMIGTGSVVLSLARHLPSGFLAFACAVIFVLSPFLRLQADYDAHWPDGSFTHDHSLAEVTVGYLATGYFPLFPWLLFPLAGYIAGRAVFPDPEDAGPEPPSVRPLGMWGVGFMLVAMLLGEVRSSVPDEYRLAFFPGWSMFPASVEYVLGSLGMALVAFGVLHAWIDRRDGLARLPGVLSVAGTMSRYSLTVYLLHHAVHLWPLWLYGHLCGTEPTHYWRQALPAEWAVVLSLACLVGSYLLFRLMARRGLPGVETLMRWVCDQGHSVIGGFDEPRPRGSVGSVATDAPSRSRLIEKTGPPE